MTFTSVICLWVFRGRSRWPLGVGVGLRPLAYCECGFETRRGHLCLSWVLCVARQMSLRWADPSYRGVLSTVCVCVCVCHWMWSGATVTHYTYNEYVERGQNGKAGMFRCGNTVLQASIYSTYPNSNCHYWVYVRSRSNSKYACCICVFVGFGFIWLMLNMDTTDIVMSNSDGENFMVLQKWIDGRDSVVGIAIRYRLDRLEPEPRRGEIFGAFQTGLEAHAISCTVGTGSFPGLKRLERGADHPPSNATLRMTRSYASVRLLCLPRHVMGDLYLYLYINECMHLSRGDSEYS